MNKQKKDKVEACNCNEECTCGEVCNCTEENKCSEECTCYEEKCNCGENCTCDEVCHCGDECNCDDTCNCEDCNDDIVNELNNQIANLKEALLRNQAELQNYKRRKDEETERFLKYKLRNSSINRLAY